MEIQSNHLLRRIGKSRCSIGLMEICFHYTFHSNYTRSFIALFRTLPRSIIHASGDRLRQLLAIQNTLKKKTAPSWICRYYIFFPSQLCYSPFMFTLIWTMLYLAHNFYIYLPPIMMPSKSFLSFSLLPVATILSLSISLSLALLFSFFLLHLCIFHLSQPSVLPRNGQNSNGRLRFQLRLHPFVESN